MDTLKALVEEKMQKDRISLRKSSRLVGVSPTTMSRIRDGGTADMSTIIKVCKWLGVNPSEVLNSETGNLCARLSALLEANPKLAAMFEEALGQVAIGEIPPETINDLLAYAAYRIGSKR